MRISPLNLISTPLAVLNTLGLDLRVGLSSDDPMVGRHPSEEYDVYLSIYSPEGVLLQRPHLGKVPPERRRFFDVSSITRNLVPGLDHLAVVHRIPSSLASQIDDPQTEVELPREPDYSLFRSLVEYSYPQGGNGSVIYETPPGLNSGQRSSNTFTFTCQTVLSDSVDTQVVLLNSSVDRSYAKIANFTYGLHALSGELVCSDTVSIGPYGVKVIDLAQIVPEQIALRERDPEDGVSAFTFIGYSEDASIISLLVNTSPKLGGVAVEHTHPPQAYMFPLDGGYQRTAKSNAQRAWKSILPAGRSS